MFETILDTKTKEKILEESSKVSPNRSASPSKSKRTLATEVKSCAPALKHIPISYSKLCDNFISWGKKLKLIVLQDPLNVKNLENINRSHTPQNLSQDPSNKDQNVVLYPSAEESSELEDRVRDFAASLFWVLESKRCHIFQFNHYRYNKLKRTQVLKAYPILIASAKEFWHRGTLILSGQKLI